MTRRSAPVGVLAGLFAVLLASAASAQPAPGAVTPPVVAPPAATAPAAAAPDAPASLKVAQDLTRRLKVQVMIDGKGPFDFLIDTGSDRTVISRELAAQLGLVNGPTVVMHETIGVEEVQTVVIRHLLIGNRMIDRIESPAVGEADLGAAGLLGIDALHDLHIVMDFKTMRLMTSASRAEPYEPDAIVVHGHSRFGQLILVDAEVHGVPVSVVLDTGSDLSVGNSALRKLLTGRERGIGVHPQAIMISVTGRRRSVELETIAETRIGGLAVRNLPLGFDELPIFDRFGLSHQPAMLLGMDVLSQCRRISIDFHRREAVFTLN
jgi:predicted aspartyl protease